MSAVTNPSSTDFVNPDPPSTDNITQEESISMSYSMNGSNLSNGTSPDANDDLNSPDSATGNTPDADDHLLLSRKHRTHNDMMKYVNQYAAAKGFIPLHRGKGFFEPDKHKQYFPHESHHPMSLGSIDTETTSNKQPRQRYIECSAKSSGRAKDVACCFQAYYLFDSTEGRFLICDKFTNLSHNCKLPSQLPTVVDGRTVVNMEHHLTPDEFVCIKEQSRCHVSVPQMHVNLEESFPHCTFTAPMLHQMGDKVLKEKYGDNLHNLHNLCMKGDQEGTQWKIH
jgi:hypothetical protein